MRQQAQVLRAEERGYVEVRVRRASACGAAHGCGSCDHCGMLSGAPELVVRARDPLGARVGDTVTVETATAGVLSAAALLYLVPFLLFFALYLAGGGMGLGEEAAIVLGGGGFALGLLGAYALERYRRKHRLEFRVTAIQS